VVLCLGSPLAAAGWEMPARWADSRDLLNGFTRVLTWLGVAPVPGIALKCDRSSSIDPNGCPKALTGDHGGGSIPNQGRASVREASIEPNG
jgi:hypothetical protein